MDERRVIRGVWIYEIVAAVGLLVWFHGFGAGYQPLATLIVLLAPAPVALWLVRR